ncbi:MAG: DUF2272 domain-containing protein [Acidiferrobacterales bacterium]|nr:DUF2272 domain-containing protein [Acidiferrobacterales bacterium]
MVFITEAADRLPRSEFDVRPPSLWVEGEIGDMRIKRSQCRQFPAEQLRKRIVDIALQEWAFFGSREYRARTAQEEVLPSELRRQRRPRLSLQESIRLASSIAGYWSATAEGEWIVARQNDRWNQSGEAARWRDAWSAAFISWVMCEAGINSSEQFRFAIAHHSYIDQAIRAREENKSNSIYVAYDSGEAEVALGDLLCTGTRPRYLSLAQRRLQMGEGARTHCDIVVNIDKQADVIETVGGNVQSAVTLKRHWLSGGGRILSPVDLNGRPVFAHLKLQEK